MLKIYNTLSKKIEEFKPLKPQEVKIYVCGPTVYSFLHIGNFRGPVFFNFVRNWFEYLGYKTEYALNFTDVDDKIIARAEQEKTTAKEIAERYITEYKKDFQSLGLKPHDHNPKVTEHMNEIIQFIQKLIENNKAYAVDGDVNFSIENFKGYGSLSGRNPEDLKAGVRIDANDKKRNPLDFALWKSAKPHENLRGSSWSSPWGDGRPGWHIECSAMVHSLFGDQIDIHGGGLDLMFPHHENEIAQSEGCTGHKYVNYWMHWNLLNLSGSKMSKSVGNVITLREFLEKNHSEVYKWMMLSVHYRSVADFSDVTQEQALSGLARVYSALALAQSVVDSQQDLGLDVASMPEDSKYAEELKSAWQKIVDFINDDFSTPQAFAVMFEQIRFFNTMFKRGLKVKPEQAKKALMFIDFMKKWGLLLSLFNENPKTFIRELDLQILKNRNIDVQTVENLVQKRSEARAQKNFALSDEIRAELTALQIQISDLPEGSYWEVAK